jgi:hypothetical protein
VSACTVRITVEEHDDDGDELNSATICAGVGSQPFAPLVGRMLAAINPPPQSLIVTGLPGGAS